MTARGQEPQQPETDPALVEAAVAGVRWISLARGLSEVVGLVTMVVLARLIAPAEFGVFVIALIVQELALSILGESVGAALVQRPELRRAHLQVAQVISMAIGAVLAAVTLFVLVPLLVSPLFGARTADMVRALDADLPDRGGRARSRWRCSSAGSRSGGSA